VVRAFSTGCVSTIRKKVERAAILDIIPQHHLLQQRDACLGDLFVALVLQ